MNTQEKIALASQILNNTPSTSVKILRNDNSLLERTETSRIILTEDNRELLRD